MKQNSILDYNNSKTTIVAVPLLKVGAVGMIRLSGPETPNIADQVFKGKISQQKVTLHIWEE
ncbi:MAG: hypothetical protein IPN15_06825 [Saprospiraceae bacterium]|nr:hypothetical protein [Candidatus Vicinibacter affinis]